MYIYESHMGGLFVSDDELETMNRHIAKLAEIPIIFLDMLKPEKKHGTF